MPSGATTYTYNGDGQRTASTPAGGSATNYSYNAAGNATGVSGAVTASYTYNGDGLRASKTVGSTTTTFTYDTNGDVPLLLTDGANDYVYGPGGILVEQFASSGGSSQYYFTDAHGSTVALTNSSGTVDATYVYSAWGAMIAHTGSASTPIEFASAYADAETGLLYLVGRYYDPSTAVFMSIDPLVSETLQAYMYGSDNPLNALDPLGLWSWADTWDVVGLVALGVVIVGLTATGVGAVSDAITGPAEVGLGVDLGAELTIEAGTEAGSEVAEGTSDAVSTASRAASTASKVAKVAKVVKTSADWTGKGLDAAQCIGTQDVGSCVGAIGDGVDVEGDAVGSELGGSAGKALRDGVDSDTGLFGDGLTLAGLPGNVDEATQLYCDTHF